MAGSASGATTERVMEMLHRETQHRSIAELARGVQVSPQAARNLIRQLADEGRLDVSRGGWPHGYLLKADGHAQG